VSIADLLSKPEFWAALFGALAAFLLGALGTWWATSTSKRTVGNLTLVVLGQMYTLMQDIRRRYVVDEPIRAQKALGRPPYSFELRAAIGLPNKLPDVPFDQLGFLADSHDPDVLNRLLVIARGFESLVDMVRRHEQLTTELKKRLQTLDSTGMQTLTTGALVEHAGVEIFVAIDDVVHELQKGLPQICDALLLVSKQLRNALCAQFPLRRFVRFTPTQPRNVTELPRDLDGPAIWRRVTRWCVDVLRKPIRLRRRHVEKRPAEPEPPRTVRFPPRAVT
jgi:hypothetical protein